MLILCIRWSPILYILIKYSSKSKHAGCFVRNSWIKMCLRTGAGALDVFWQAACIGAARVLECLIISGQVRFPWLTTCLMQGRKLVTVLPFHQYVIWNNHSGYLTVTESLSSEGKGNCKSDWTRAFQVWKYVLPTKMSYRLIQEEMLCGLNVHLHPYYNEKD